MHQVATAADRIDYWIRRRIVVCAPPADLQRIHKYMLEVEHIDRRPATWPHASYAGRGANGQDQRGGQPQ